MSQKLFSRRQNFHRQIRNKYVDLFRAECRSKMLEIYVQNSSIQREYQFLDDIFGNKDTSFAKIYLLLKNLIEEDIKGAQEKNLTKQRIKINSCISFAQTDKLYFTVAGHEQQKCISIHQLVLCLQLFSKELCKKIQNLNQCLKALSKFNIKSKNYREEDLKIQMSIILQEMMQFQSASYYTSYLLQKFVHYLATFQAVNINQPLIETLLLCLIEVSCFRPRSYTSQIELQIVKSVNKLMHQQKILLNNSITSNLISFVKLISPNDIKLSMIINLINIFGNIFVSLSSNSQQNTSQYAELHTVCFSLFNVPFKMRNESQTKEQKIQTYTEFYNTTVWFIRNQILIVLGLYKKMRVANSEKQLNQQWVSLIDRIIQCIFKSFYQTKNLSNQQSSTLTDIISILKLLSYDFELQKYRLSAMINKLILFFKQSNQDTLNEEILLFSAQLLQSKLYERQTQIWEHKNVQKYKFYEFIYQTVSETLQNGRFSLGRVKLCIQVLQNVVFLNQKQDKFYQQICSNFQLIMKNRQKITDYQEIKSFLLLINEVMKMSEQRNINKTMIFQFFSYENIKTILILCSRIWQIEKCDQDIIDTLLLLQFIAQNEEYSQILKQAIQNEGYQDQLENLSAHTNQDINRIITQIFEILNLQS